MTYIKTEDAVGQVLCHDITQIIPGVKKGPVFKKGHIIQEEDIPVLLSVGKEHLYVWEKHEGILHEDDAAAILRDICMGNSSEMSASQPSEGKIEITAAIDGLLKINSEKLLAVNSLGQMMIATIHGNTAVKKGDKLAGTRIIPLVIEEEKMKKARELAGDKPLLSILPFKPAKVGIVVTGSEIAKGLIEDAFTPVLEKKLSEYDTQILGQQLTGDDKEKITNAVLDFARKGADIILCTGGMSVDPDDRTPGAIKDTGAEIISYGSPVLPGAMFLLAYLNHNEKRIPLMGLPGCVMYAGRTVFDLVLPRILTGEVLTAADLAAYGEGGLCLGCKPCHYPNCGFGK
ncbi:Molybdopterin biosynthesis enzyme [Treponema sp. JC4]|uniref:molybdopterin-binding protein n=1 Tax=Treponema sp. JC4 TaxID=1124982 RepID=UPI00025B0D9F|nr:molybdopterin-binding protein [Treponema sp. JC4]EID85794.1 Molybdopterin biosynthesis enzyme [Treponema sp. JC4]